MASRSSRRASGGRGGWLLVEVRGSRVYLVGRGGSRREVARAGSVGAAVERGLAEAGARGLPLVVVPRPGRGERGS